MHLKKKLQCRILLIIIGSIVLNSCTSSSRKLPDVSNIKVAVHIHRFDQDLMLVDTNNVLQGLVALHKKYPVFLPVYLSQVMNYGAYSDTGKMMANTLHDFLISKDILDLQDTINAHFTDVRGLESKLAQGFRYMKYYFPKYKVPRCIAFVSGLNNYGAITIDTILGIGLDMFLGKDYPNYRKVADPYPQYMLPHFAPQYITADCFKAIEQQLFPAQQQGNTLLGQMIEEGKQLFFLDHILPNEPDTIKTGFTKKQLQWCNDNEQQVWQYFVQNNLLYIHDMQQIAHYIGEGPSTQGMPPAAPGNIGSWVGWQIIKKYQEAHPEKSLLQIMQLKNPQTILNEAHYRPR